MTRGLAPACVIRAAAFPLDALDGFGEPELARAIGAADFSARYAAALERERALLWERTAGDSAFMKALVLASPSLFARVRAARGPRTPRDKRARHLETSLYRYLARAATRTTPNGLWAGVTSAAFAGERDALGPRPARADFTPDLAPFAAAFSALAGRAEYRGAARFRLNPTLAPAPDRSLTFVARAPGGAIDARALAWQPALGAALERLRGHDAATIDELARVSRLPTDVVAQLVDGGVLIGGLAFPSRFTTPWSALDAAADALRGADREALRACMAALSNACAELCEAFSSRDADALLPPLERAREALTAFFRAVDLPRAHTDKPVRCDLRLPCGGTLGETTRRALLDLLGAYEREWIAGASPGSSFRHARRRALEARLGAAGLALGAAPSSPEGSAPRFVPPPAWVASFDAQGDAVRLEPADEPEPSGLTAPWGCFIARLGARGPDWALGIDDSPTRPFARHVPLLDDGDALVTWLSSTMSAFERAHGTKVAELVVPMEKNPNVLARPDLGVALVEPWGTDGAALDGARLELAGGAVILNHPALGHTLVLCLSGARVVDSDPIAEALALSGFEENVPPGFRASAMLHPSEHATPRYAPRLCLSNGAVVRPRRTYAAGGALARQTASREAAYPRWQALARELGWPARVLAAVDGETALCLDPSSPLALEALLEGASGARHILIEEAPAEGSLLLGGKEHMADIVVPFSRERHAFSPKEKEPQP